MFQKTHEEVNEYFRSESNEPHVEILYRCNELTNSKGGINGTNCAFIFQEDESLNHYFNFEVDRQ